MTDCLPESYVKVNVVKELGVKELCDRGVCERVACDRVLGAQMGMCQKCVFVRSFVLSFVRLFV